MKAGQLGRSRGYPDEDLSLSVYTTRRIPTLSWSSNLDT